MLHGGRRYSCTNQPDIHPRYLQPGAPLLVETYEILNASVVGFFDIIRKVACRQFVHFAVIVQAVTAHACSLTWIRTIAVCQIAAFFTFHIDSSF